MKMTGLSSGMPFIARFERVGFSGMSYKKANCYTKNGGGRILKTYFDKLY
jgi:hypothetical protein